MLDARSGSSGVTRRLLVKSALGCVLVNWCAVGNRCKAADGWPYQRIQGPFVIFSDFRQDGSTGLLNELGLLQTDLVRLLGIPPTREAIQLYWFAKQGTYEAYLTKHFPNVPARRALFVKRNGPGMMLAHLHEDFAVDVRHECTHALLHAVLPMVPLWLDEGLAEYFEAPRQDRAAGNPHLGVIRNRLRFGRIARVHELEALQQVGDMRIRDYQDAWAWVHFMLQGPVEARVALQTYLADLAAERPPGSLGRRLEQRWPDVDQRLRKHFRQTFR